MAVVSLGGKCWFGVDSKTFEIFESIERGCGGNPPSSRAGCPTV